MILNPKGIKNSTVNNNNNMPVLMSGTDLAYYEIFKNEKKIRTNCYSSKHAKIVENMFGSNIDDINKFNRKNLKN